MKKTGKILMYVGVGIIPLFILFTLIVALATQTNFNSSDMGAFLAIFGIGMALPIVAGLIIVGAVVWLWGRYQEKKG
ncbi:hypothetical protein HYW73_00915 [Candidatus Nomurabacteria bacterium]|nr:hypothetical protein [Candidatus Nomurabacteria bacterium]